MTVTTDRTELRKFKHLDYVTGKGGASSPAVVATAENGASDPEGSQLQGLKARSNLVHAAAGSKPRPSGADRYMDSLNG